VKPVDKEEDFSIEIGRATEIREEQEKEEQEKEQEKKQEREEEHKKILTKIKDLISFISSGTKEEAIQHAITSLEEIKEIAGEKKETVENMIHQTGDRIKAQQERKENLNEAINLLETSSQRQEQLEDYKDEVEEVKRYIRILNTRRKILETQKFLITQYMNLVSSSLDSIKELKKGGLDKKELGQRFTLGILTRIVSIVLGFSGPVSALGALGLPIG